MAKCTAKTSKGTRCSYSAKPGKKFCGIHLKGYSGGRPTSYKDEYAEQAYKLTLLGATDKELADFFKVDESTINEWKHKVPEFSKSLTRGKEIADAEVAHSFYKRAIGYDYEELKQEGVKNNSSFTVTKVVKTKKHIAGDPGAALNWLKNRQKNKWRDKVEVDHTSKGERIQGSPIIASNPKGEKPHEL